MTQYIRYVDRNHIPPAETGSETESNLPVPDSMDSDYSEYSSASVSSTATQPNVDYSFKEGQTIRVKLGTKATGDASASSSGASHSHNKPLTSGNIAAFALPKPKTNIAPIAPPTAVKTQIVVESTIASSSGNDDDDFDDFVSA